MSNELQPKALAAFQSIVGGALRVTPEEWQELRRYATDRDSPRHLVDLIDMLAAVRDAEAHALWAYPWQSPLLTEFFGALYKPNA